MYGEKSSSVQTALLYYAMLHFRSYITRHNDSRNLLKMHHVCKSYKPVEGVAKPPKAEALGAFPIELTPTVLPILFTLLCFSNAALCLSTSDIAAIVAIKMKVNSRGNRKLALAQYLIRYGKKIVHLASIASMFLLWMCVCDSQEI